MTTQIINEGVTPVKVWTNDIEESAREQLVLMSQLPFIHKHIAVMPDVHAGRGSTIGSVIPTKGKIIPATVGVDLGCGMSAMKLEGVDPSQLDGKLKKIRSEIEKVIPLGFDTHKAGYNGLKALKPGTQKILTDELKIIEERSRGKKQGKILRGLDKFDKQMGSLGGGNHFIEICVSLKNEVWLMLHSGSRGVGNQIAQYHIEKAQKVMEADKIRLPHKDLSYLSEGTTEFDEYYNDMIWCQKFAYHNRRAMQELILRRLIKILKFKRAYQKLDFIDCHHNYVAKETHYGEEVLVTRKGAVKAGVGDYGIIPGSMGAKSYIVKGLGNPESFNSCSHGAGRKMSRSKAKKTFTENDIRVQTQGVECKKDGTVLDEIPSAYKDIDEVMANQVDLVEPVEELRQVICVKG